MNAVCDRPSYRLYPGDCLDVLRQMSAGNIHCCVTSPPEIPERCIRAGTPQFGVCSVCGKPSTIDCHPICDCGCQETIPATVLDPFAGSGTTLMVAMQLGRNSIGIELNDKYIELAKRRIERVIQQQPLFFEG